VLCGRARDNLADGTRAGVEDVVKLELEERRRLRDRAVDADERGRVEVLGEEVGDERGDVRGLLGGL
jgi:predicted AAA+ superfamily ATPase